jgi:hypothetical protein
VQLIIGDVLFGRPWQQLCKLKESKMKKLKRIMSVLVLFALAAIGLSAQAQRRSNRVADRQVSGILQQLEQSANRFRGNLNTALILAHIDETRPRNDINSFEPAFVSAIDQFRNRFTQHVAVAADVENILQRASLVNGFMTRNRLNPQVQNDWFSVRTNLNALANAYSLTWQWNRQTPPVVSSNRPMSTGRLSDRELNQLIQRIETGGDTFRSSLTDAFGRTGNNQTAGEGDVNNAVRDFKIATDQLRNRFDANQPGKEYVERVLARATPIDTYMRGNRLTNRAQNDWSALRGELNTLAGAYELSTNWQVGRVVPVRQETRGNKRSDD